MSYLIKLRHQPPSETLWLPCHNCARATNLIWNSCRRKTVYKNRWTPRASDTRMTVKSTTMNIPWITLTVVRTIVNKNIRASLVIWSRRKAVMTVNKCLLILRQEIPFYSPFLSIYHILVQFHRTFWSRCF